MAKISLALVLCVATIASASNINVEQHQLSSMLDEPHIKYYMACIRGFSDGFGQGMYKNSSEGTPKECLGEGTYKKMIELAGFINSGNFVEIFKSIGKFYQIGFDIQKDCRFNQYSFELTAFCLNRTNNCSISNMITTLQSNFFKITGAANNIAEVVFQEYQNFGKKDITKIEDALATYTQLGKSFGEVARTVTGFNKTYYEGGRRRRNPNVSLSAKQLFLEEFEIEE